MALVRYLGSGRRVIVADATYVFSVGDSKEIINASALKTIEKINLRATTPVFKVEYPTLLEKVLPEVIIEEIPIGVDISQIPVEIDLSQVKIRARKQPKKKKQPDIFDRKTKA